MKKTLIILMSIISLSANAQNVDLHLKKAGTGMSVGGALIILGATVHYLQASDEYTGNNQEAWDAFKRNQKEQKIISFGCYALSGVCFIISGTQLMKFKAGNKATAYVMPNGIGLRF